MKNLILISVLLFFSFSIYSQSEKSLARVQKIKGKEIYIYCEPVREYEVVEKVTSFVSQLTAGLSDEQPSIDNMIKEMVDKSIDREIKNKIGKFDAILTTDGESAVLIKFKAGNDDNKGLGNVQRIQGKYIFLYCDPINEFDNTGQITSAISQLFGTNSISNMVKEMIDKAIKKEIKNKVKPFDGIITSDGTNGVLIKFK